MNHRFVPLLVAGLACSSPTEPAEPTRELALPAGISLASGQYGFDPTTREYVIFLGLRNETTVAVDVMYGLCTFVVAGFATPSLSGPRLWSRLLPQQNGCGPDIGLILRVNPQSTGYITVGTVPGNVLNLSDYVGLILKIAGETSLRGVSLVESVVNAGATPSP